VAGAVQRKVKAAPPGTFFARADFAGPSGAVESALSRLVAAGEILRVRRGMYWKGKQTRFGMTRPTPLQIAIQVAGPGSGPTGVAAAHLLGLTTQVPATAEVAVPGRVPDPVDGVRFRARSFDRRLRGLRPLEVAVLELLRDPGSAEVPWDEIATRVLELAVRGDVRLSVLTDEAADEAAPAVRGRLRELVRP